MRELKVIDEEFESYRIALDACREAIEQKIQAYLTSLEAISRYVITEGQVANNIRLFTSCASGLKGLTEESVQSMQNTLSVFVSEIDSADEHIY